MLFDQFSRWGARLHRKRGGKGRGEENKGGIGEAHVSSVKKKKSKRVTKLQRRGRGWKRRF